MKAILLAAIFLGTPLSACLWDYDTLAQESAGLPDVKVVIVGGFARNPALYYEMRLERVTKLLAENPDDLDAYDAAGVACDRLGRHDEAIEWMARKQASMDRAGYDKDTQPNHKYRYLANLGTFHAHRWFKTGAKRDNLRDLETARDLVTAAITENPEAHFGREKYQLRFIEWLIAGPRFTEDEAVAKGLDQRAGWMPNFLELGGTERFRVSTGDTTNLEKAGLADAVQGICGLITQGTAWESVDAFYALAILLQMDGKSAFSHFAMCRLDELLKAGKRSIVAQAPTTVEDFGNYASWPPGGPTTDRTSAESEFQSLRTDAQSWHKQRGSYMLVRLNAGRHPDTDPEFWSEFEGDPNQMEVPAGFIYGTSGLLRSTLSSLWFWIGAIVFVVIPGVIVYYIYAKRRDARRKTTPRAA